MAVFIVHVESVKMVWVCREEDEVRVSLLMDKLARLGEELKPAQRMKKGAAEMRRVAMMALNQMVLVLWTCSSSSSSQVW